MVQDDPNFGDPAAPPPNEPPLSGQGGEEQRRRRPRRRRRGGSSQGSGQGPLPPVETILEDSGSGDSFADYQSPFLTGAPTAEGFGEPAPPAPIDFSELSPPPRPETPMPVTSPEPEPTPTPPPPSPPSPAPEYEPPVPEYAPPPPPPPPPEPVPPALEPAPIPPVAPESVEPLEGEVIEQAPPDIPFDTPPEEGRLEDLAMEGSLSQKIQQLLQDANLTPRHLRFCCGGVFAIGLVILVAAFLVPKLFSGDLFDREKTPQEPVEETPSDEEPSRPIESSQDIGEGPVWVDPSVYTSFLVGEPFSEIEGDTGIDTSLLVGKEEIEVSDDFTLFIKYIQRLEDLYNLYNIDVHEVLDQSTDRVTALENHIDELKDIYNAAVLDYEEIQVIRTRYTERIDLLTSEKDLAETAFFDDIAEFRGVSADEQLQVFIETSQTLVEVKARYQAYGKLGELYEIILGVLRDKIEALELNRGPLISGVRVVEVEGYDLDLILQEGELQE